MRLALHQFSDPSGLQYHYLLWHQFRSQSDYRSQPCFTCRRSNNSPEGISERSLVASSESLSQQLAAPGCQHALVPAGVLCGAAFGCTYNEAWLQDTACSILQAGGGRFTAERSTAVLGKWKVSIIHFYMQCCCACCRCPSICVSCIFNPATSDAVLNVQPAVCCRSQHADTVLANMQRAREQLKKGRWQSKTYKYQGGEKSTSSSGTAIVACFGAMYCNSAFI